MRLKTNIIRLNLNSSVALISVGFTSLCMDPFPGFLHCFKVYPSLDTLIFGYLIIHKINVTSIRHISLQLRHTGGILLGIFRSHHQVCPSKSFCDLPALLFFYLIVSINYHLGEIDVKQLPSFYLLY